MIDCKKYSNKAFLQLLKGNIKYQQIIANAKKWDEVVNVINSLDLDYTTEQLSYVKQNQWD